MFGHGNGGRLIRGTAYTRVYTVHVPTLAKSFTRASVTKQYNLVMAKRRWWDGNSKSTHSPKGLQLSRLQLLYLLCILFMITQNSQTPFMPVHRCGCSDQTLPVVSVANWTPRHWLYVRPAETAASRLVLRCRRGNVPTCAAMTSPPNTSSPTSETELPQSPALLPFHWKNVHTDTEKLYIRSINHLIKR